MAPYGSSRLPFETSESSKHLSCSCKKKIHIYSCPTPCNKVFLGQPRAVVIRLLVVTRGKAVRAPLKDLGRLGSYIFCLAAWYPQAGDAGGDALVDQLTSTHELAKEVGWGCLMIGRSVGKSSCLFFADGVVAGLREHSSESEAKQWRNHGGQTSIERSE